MLVPEIEEESMLVPEIEWSDFEAKDSAGSAGSRTELPLEPAENEEEL
jgi:hypothetical protein